MTNRFDAKPTKNFGVNPLPTGYDGKSTDYVIPSSGIEDVDRALFNHIKTGLPLQVSMSAKNVGDLKTVPVIFVGGEKWALSKRHVPHRDASGAIIIPAISVSRTQISQDISDITTRGINQQTGEIVIKRRLDKMDRGYQNLINKFFLGQQSDTAVPLLNAIDGQLSTDRVIGQNMSDPDVYDGATLKPTLKNNIYEFIVLPSPQFCTLKYEITFWAQYQIQMNQMIECLISSFLQQGNCWKLTTDKGYWFIASVEANQYTPDTNADDISTEEKYIKYKFNVNIPAFIFATSTPGAPIPVRRYVSSPDIHFSLYADVQIDDNIVSTGELLGTDDPTLPLSLQQNGRDDQRYDGTTMLNRVETNDPALGQLNRGEKPQKYKRVQYYDNNLGKVVSRMIRITAGDVGETSYHGIISIDDNLIIDE